jgi:glutathione S-transferase
MVKSSLAILDATLGKTPFLAGNHLSIADLVIASELVALELLSFDFTVYPNLWRWFEVISSRASWGIVHRYYLGTFVPAVLAALKAASS